MSLTGTQKIITKNQFSKEEVPPTNVVVPSKHETPPQKNRYGGVSKIPALEDSARFNENPYESIQLKKNTFKSQLTKQNLENSAAS